MPSETKTPTEKMYERGFGTGHPMDVRPTQVEVDSGEVHNILRRVTDMGMIVGVVEPIPMTMCGLKLDNEGVPYNSGITTCTRCAILAAHKVVSVYQ